MAVVVAAAMVGRTDPTPGGHTGRNLGLRGTQEGGVWSRESPFSKNLGVNLDEEGLPCPVPQYGRV